MGDHDVSVDGDGEDVEDGDPEEAVPQERVELAELRAPDPPLGQELGGGQGQVEAAEQEVGHGEVDDEDGGGVPDLLAPDQGQDGDDVAREAADEEHDAADEGRHEHPVRVPLTWVSRLASSSPLSSRSWSSPGTTLWREAAASLGNCPVNCFENPSQ